MVFANYVLENYIDTEFFPPSMQAEESNGKNRTTNGTKSYYSQIWFKFYMLQPSMFQVVRIKTIY